MTQKASLIIRDAIADDIPHCLELDHSYQTDFVWKTTLNAENNTWLCQLQEERLPRSMEAQHTPHPQRLKHALQPQHCYLVASYSDGSILGYLVMLNDPFEGLGVVKDVVVDAPFRRRGIGARLMRIARQWAVAHQIQRILAETQTKNHPTIQLYQRTGYTFCGFNDHYYANQDIAVFFCQQTR